MNKQYFTHFEDRIVTVKPFIRDIKMKHCGNTIYVVQLGPIRQVFVNI